MHILKKISRPPESRAGKAAGNLWWSRIMHIFSGYLNLDRELESEGLRVIPNASPFGIFFLRNADVIKAQ